MDRTQVLELNQHGLNSWSLFPNVSSVWELKYYLLREPFTNSADGSAHCFIKLVDVIQQPGDDTLEPGAHTGPHILHFSNKLKDFQGTFEYEQLFLNLF